MTADRHGHDENCRRISQKELSDIALAAAKEGATQTVSKLFAVFDVNVSNEDQVRKLRDAITFLYSLEATARVTRHRVWLTFVTILSSAIIIAIGDAIWILIRAKVR